MYADYDFYTKEFYGGLSEKEFNRLSIRARYEIDRITTGRASDAKGKDLEAVKYAQCAVVDELYKIEMGGDIASESNDGISRSFASGAARSKSQRITEAARVYLDATNLCFVGV